MLFNVSIFVAGVSYCVAGEFPKKFSGSISVLKGPFIPFKRPLFVIKAPYFVV